jgi:hypothetical protein
VTIWPTSNGNDIEMSAPWPAISQEANKKWTGAFDTEGRANRMSYMVGNALLPSAPNQHRWSGEAKARNRMTWMNGGPRQGVPPVWEGSFAVEQRASWISRNSDTWADDFEIEKEKAKWKQPVTQEQLDQADSSLVTVEVLKYEYDGQGTPESPYLVRWMETDPANPLQVPNSKKWINAMILALAVFMVSIASSGFSQGKKIRYGMRH